MTRMIREGFGLVQTLRPETMTDFVTPAAGLFSVWHLGIPDVRDRAWTLTIGGRGRAPADPGPGRSPVPAATARRNRIYQRIIFVTQGAT